MTSALPDNTGYVAAAYLVVFALVLVYLVIMARKLARFEREIVELNELADTRVAPERDRDTQAAARLGTREVGAR